METPLLLSPASAGPHGRNAVSPELADAAEVLSHLRGGDTLAHCQATGWRLVRADLPVDDLTVRVLLEAPWSARRREGRRGGRLVPQDDGLPGIGAAQTWAWVEGADRVCR